MTPSDLCLDQAGAGVKDGLEAQRQVRLKGWCSKRCWSLNLVKSSGQG